MKALLCALLETALVAALLGAVWLQPKATDRLLRRPCADERLRLAAWRGEDRPFHEALGDGARVTTADQTGATALTCAAITGQREMVAELLRRGADVNARTRDGATPLMYAAINDHAEVVLLLLANGADPSRRATSALATALDMATLTNARRCQRILRAAAAAKAAELDDDDVDQDDLRVSPDTVRPQFLTPQATATPIPPAAEARGDK